MKATNFSGCCLSLPLVLILSEPVAAAEYVFRDLMGNTLAPSKCVARNEAVARATEPYTIDKFAKRFCEVQGYGWNLAEQKSDGKLLCDECSGDANQGKYQCRVEDIIVTCKRLKPGSVGLFPGKG